MHVHFFFFSQKEEVSRSQVVLLCCLALYRIGLIDLIMYMFMYVYM